MTLNDATVSQNRAADPEISTWLSSNAGSGKTRVLTDRVARLLLGGTDPQNILCLTYTKAAAGEMQNRLFRGLGAWAMLPDADLRRHLSDIGEVPPDDLSHARTLFARAVETPGGLKIQTIHSFCSALLRQFPLEAGVSPGFRELDEAGQEEVIERVLDQLVETHPESIQSMARLYSGESLVALCQGIVHKRDAFRQVGHAEDIRAAFGLTPSDDLQSALNTLANAIRGPWWTQVLDVLGGLTKSYQNDAAKLRNVDPSNLTEEGFAVLRSVFLYASDNRPKVGSYPQANHSSAVAAVAPWRTELDDLSLAVSACLETILALDAVGNTRVLHAFANRFLSAYRAEKDRIGVLDFDDLIERARTLLSDRSLSWVLYRLDGRIDHILVDEAQDTSPAQWSVIGALAEELAAGEGADRSQTRSLFVVGDKKQSIYSFQGADARAFDGMADHFKSRMTNGLVRHELLYSFRSSPAILDVVDATLDDATGQALGSDVRHRAFHETFPGRVDLWPLQERQAPAEPPPWYDPVDRVSDGDPSVILADRLAGKIRDLIENGSIQESSGHVRRITPGDFLILVQRRSTLFDQIIRACKALELPIAGADRLKINAALAVKDLTSLLSFLALPEDDLSLAAALRSPIFGWSEAELFGIAARRDGAYLWQRLRENRDAYPETVAILDELRARADFERPFELLELVLGKYGGRRSLVGRLGPEAEDGIDELLAHALRYEQRAVPHLTGFLAQLSSEDLEIKRATDTTDDLIRVMTIHGAKGLESPIVILPDTIRQDATNKGEFVITADGLPVWKEPAARAPAVVREAGEEAAETAAEERQRLLYVAMTRAESWLIVAGVMPGRTSKSIQWHEAIEAGLTKVGATWITDGEDEVLRYERGAWPQSAPAASEVAAQIDTPQRVEFGAVPPPPSQMSSVAPSDLGGPKALPGEGGLDEEAAKRRGVALHSLLETLPAFNETDWPQIASSLLGTSFSDTERRQFVSEAAACIKAHPELFGPETLAEVDMTAYLPSLNCRMDGIVDRLVISEGPITIIDYKTNAVRPKTPDETPDGILRQMGAYHEAARAIWPEREFKLIVLWTVDATCMEIPHDLVIDALSRAARP